MAANIGDDSFVHLVTTSAHRGGIGQPAQAENGDFGGAATNIDHHAANRLGNGHIRANRRCHRLKDQMNVRGPCVRRRIADRAAFNRGGARRHTDHDFGVAKHALLAVHLLDEVLDHLFGHFDVGDHTIAQRADRLDAVGGLPHHHLRIIANCLHAADAVDRLNRDHRRFVQNDPLILHVNQRVGGSEIDRHVLRTEAEEIGQKTHWWWCSSGGGPRTA